MGFTDAYAKTVANHVFRNQAYTPPSVIYAAYSKSAGVEVTSTEIALVSGATRVAITIGAATTLSATAWAQAHGNYVANDIVSNGGNIYICIIAHSPSASFATDLPTKWLLITPVTLTSITNDVTFGATNTGQTHSAVEVALFDAASAGNQMTNWRPVTGGSVSLAPSQQFRIPIGSFVEMLG